MKKVIVNCRCLVSVDNPTPSKDQDVAINITSLDESSDFKNLVLSIDNDGQCCEEWGTGKNIEDGIYDVDYIQEAGYLSYDEVKELFNLEVIYDEPIIMEVVLKNGNRFLAGVYNEHNGYYSHEVYINSNGEVEIDYL